MPKLAWSLVPLILVACTAPAEQKPQPAPQAEAPSAPAVLRLRNQGRKVVFKVRFREEQGARYGGDRLSEGDIVKPGAERDFKGVPHGDVAAIVGGNAAALYGI